MIDEADTLLPGNAQLRGILNAGYTPDMAYVLRVVSEAGGSRLARFSCWGPKAIAQIGRLPETLADRCIVIRMERKKGDEECELSRGLDGAELRARCERFVMEHVEEIANGQPEIPEGLNDRAADIWEPLLVLAEIAGGDWPAKAREAAVGLTARAQEGSLPPPPAPAAADAAELLSRRPLLTRYQLAIARHRR